jgi:peptidoglycan/LPS O-acetylase OafA/YrhL
MRLREIDFLRGVAVILVIFNHSTFLPFIHKAGWIGVDLFFVLSGFLVSGLLFEEYNRYGNVKPGLFLIRRGFKIYPLFYFTILVALVLEYLTQGHLPAYYQIVSEMIFLQSYIKGILGITWSLAVEEHFYFALVILIFIGSWSRVLLQKNIVLRFCVAIFILCLGLRIQKYALYPFRDLTHHFPTHLRIDALLFGVLISYYFHYFRSAFDYFFRRNRGLIFSLALVGLSIPFIFSRTSFFVYTVGLTMIYISFGLILCLFLTDGTINSRLNSVFSKTAVTFVSRIGFYSYGIYLWHMMIIRYLMKYLQQFTLFSDGSVVEFVTYFIFSIVTGIFFSWIVEQYFLKVRDWYFPKRSTEVYSQS